MIYVTEMDVDDASFRQVVQDLTDRYGKVIAPHFQPIRENEKLVGYVNVIKNAGRRYTVSDREKSARSRITASRTWRSTERSFWRQWQRPAMNLWSVTLQEKSSP